MEMFCYFFKMIMDEKIHHDNEKMRKINFYKFSHSEAKYQTKQRYIGTQIHGCINLNT